MIALSIAIGLCTGLIGGFFGIQAAFLVVTALVWFKMVPDQQTASGTTLLAFLPPVSILAIYYYWKNKKIDFSISFWIMGFYIVGAGVGALGSGKFSDEQLKLMLAILFLILSIITFIAYFRVKGTPEVKVTPTHLQFGKHLTGMSAL